MIITPEISLTLDDISGAIISVKNYSKNKVVNRIITNSIEAIEGDLFIAIDGEHESGESYTEDARARGAYILASRDINADIIVNDTKAAILSLTAYYKSLLKDLKHTVAITGSVGKTTTKNIVASMLKKCFVVHKTYENYNNFLGVFHTVMSSPIDTEVLVCEVGMNHLGEISEISKSITPTVAIITNIGTTHIGNLGTREMIAKTKLEITDGMDKDNLYCDFDEELLKGYVETQGVSFYNSDAFVRILVKSIQSGGVLFDIVGKDFLFENNTLPSPARHILSAIAYGVCVMKHIGIVNEEISRSIAYVCEGYTDKKFKKAGGYIVYDDTYSSSLEAVRADFEMLSFFPKKCCLLGDMLELGEETERLHTEVGSLAHKYGFCPLYAYGVYAPFIANGARAAGMNDNKIFINTNPLDPEASAKQILNSTDGDELILLKASHRLYAGEVLEHMRALLEEKG